LGSSINLKSGLVAVGALRPEDGNSQEPVALETTVIATGARPGDTAAKRELFTEETQTVLVFERGAVIRLSAAVADGQLLFLSNKATGKEVVTQVLRKRSFRPTNCYVDLEFTEPCPGFWGIEFPKTAVVSAGTNEAEKLSTDEDSESEPATPAAPPSLHEVDRLKHEVAALQTQLQSLLQPGEEPGPNVPRHAGAKAASEINSEIARKEEEKHLEELFAIEARQEDALSPKRSPAYSRESAIAEKQKSGGKKWMIAAAVAIVLTAAAGAAYRFGVFAAPTTTAAVSPKAAQSQPTSLAAPPVAQGIANANPKVTTAAPSADAKNSITTANVDAEDSSITAREVPASSSVRATFDSRNAKPVESTKRSKSQLTAEPRTKSAGTAKGGGVAPPGEKISDTNAEALATEEDYVAPKLVKGSKSVAPPEAIQNYVAGNVHVDAIVDTTGHLRSVTILSGPAKLHAIAMEVMKQYLYEPAKKNGKTVPAHVQVSLQFWYSP
jgi:flagellar basal body-associated protein FliL